MQGASDEVCDSLSRGEITATGLPEPEQVLLKWVELLTRESYRNTAADVDRVRKAGWTDSQIAEAVYITALFAFFNRVADAFGLDAWQP